MNNTAGTAGAPVGAEPQVGDVVANAKEVGRVLNPPKKQLFSDAAYQLRKQLLEAGDEANKVRARIVLALNRLGYVFEGEEEVSEESLQDYFEKAMAKLHPDAGKSRQFTEEGFHALGSCPDVMPILQLSFGLGEWNVTKEQVLLRAAEMRCERDNVSGRKVHTFVDADGAVVFCTNAIIKDDEAVGTCGQEFVATASTFSVPSRDGGEREVTSGHFLAINGQKRCFCFPCREKVKEEAQRKGDKKPYFLCSKEADERAGRQQYAIERSGRRQERNVGLDAGAAGVLAELEAQRGRGSNFKPRIDRGKKRDWKRDRNKRF